MTTRDLYSIFLFGERMNSRRRVGNNKITDVRGQGLIGRQEDFKINPEFNRKPM